MKAIQVEKLRKSYGAHEVLRGLDLAVEQGEVLALLGVNGAGKTTALECIQGLRSYEKGQVSVNGRMGVQLQSASLPFSIRAMEALSLFARWNGTRAEPGLLETLNIHELGKQLYGKLSPGQKRRLHLALALVGDPDILFLDEPTAGLDPKERVRFRNLISALAENRIVILSTHIVSDVEYIANEILIMKNGELIHQGAPEEILKPIEKHVWECEVPRKEAEKLEMNYVTANLKHNNGAERLRIISQEAPCKTAWNVEPTLEDLYLYYFAEVSEHE